MTVPELAALRIAASSEPQDRRLDYAAVAPGVTSPPAASPQVGPLSPVRYMGMGEPFNNYAATLDSVRALIAADAFGISPRRITISTCGVVPKIDQLAAEGLPINLAVFLHAADDRTRTAIMPVNKRWGIDEVLAASARYVERTKRRVTFEYILLAGVNDSERTAAELAARIARSGRVTEYHVNLIPVNAGPGGFTRPEPEEMERCAQILRGRQIAATVRISKGQDILAGCGQLKVEERSPANRRQAVEAG